MKISAQHMNYRELNTQVRNTAEDLCIVDCYGQRFIGSGLKEKKITVYGTPGNALGSYLDGGEIELHGNAQDAVGDTMNGGRIVVHGNAGDALGYAMRGGRIYVRGNAGYRTGIHMKEYQQKKPVIVLGGEAGSFLGEYLAGGIIIVLGLDRDGIPAGNFPATGMHGGKIFLRSECEPDGLPAQVSAGFASADDLCEAAPYITEFAECFGLDAAPLLNDRYYVLRPDAKNPYHRLYVTN